MKVTRIKNDFKPVVIEITTEAEYNALCAALQDNEGVAARASINGHTKVWKTTGAEVSDVVTTLYKALRDTK